MAAFPTHVWTILLILQDFFWIAKRTNTWDAVGAGAYGLLFAFAESIFVFVSVLLLGFLVPRRWSEIKRIVFLVMLIFIAALWAIGIQVYSTAGFPLPANVFSLLVRSAHPLRILYLSALVMIALTLILPVYGVLKSEKLVIIMKDLIERLSLLTIFYLLMDLGGLVVILLRSFRVL